LNAISKSRYRKIHHSVVADHGTVNMVFRFFKLITSRRMFKNNGMPGLSWNIVVSSKRRNNGQALAVSRVLQLGFYLPSSGPVSERLYVLLSSFLENVCYGRRLAVFRYALEFDVPLVSWMPCRLIGLGRLMANVHFLHQRKVVLQQAKSVLHIPGQVDDWVGPNKHGPRSSTFHSQADRWYNLPAPRSEFLCPACQLA
jgi:hypothetical protein